MSIWFVALINNNILVTMVIWRLQHFVLLLQWTLFLYGAVNGLTYLSVSDARFLPCWKNQNGYAFHALEIKCYLKVIDTFWFAPYSSENLFLCKREDQGFSSCFITCWKSIQISMICKVTMRVEWMKANLLDIVEVKKMYYIWHGRGGIGQY